MNVIRYNYKNNRLLIISEGEVEEKLQNDNVNNNRLLDFKDNATRKWYKTVQTTIH